MQGRHIHALDMLLNGIALVIAMNPWWTTSVKINRALCGDKTEPLCSRVYRQQPSAARSAFIRAMDLFFKEQEHCAMIHQRWNELHDTCRVSNDPEHLQGSFRAGM